VDDETIRMIQGLGLYDKVYTEIGITPDWLYFLPGGHDLDTPAVYRGNLIGDNLNVGDNLHEGGHGHKGYLFHEQPMLGSTHLNTSDFRETYP
jgi:hypothetical protein